MLRQVEVLNALDGGPVPHCSVKWSGDDLEWFGQASFLKAGMLGAAQVTTVSPGHAAELADVPTSFGLAPVVASLSPPLVGILNGIDAEAWDPARDTLIASRFDTGRLEARLANHAPLLRAAGVDDGIIFGNVGRMARQKGLALLDPVLPGLIADGLRLVLIGNGELDELVDSWVADFPTAVAHLAYDEERARRAFAGCDAYIMPSEFEPSGLGQIYAMRYGAPPVVRSTGGLADSVVDADLGLDSATGFSFADYAPDALAATLRRSMTLWADDPAAWRRLQRNGMATDWSWQVRASDYEEVLVAAGAR